MKLNNHYDFLRKSFSVVPQNTTINYFIMYW